MNRLARYASCTALDLGARGSLRRAAFVLAGRVAVRSANGGLWNEWTLAFDDGRTGILAEALGVFTVFFAAPLALPFASLRVGEAPETGFVVVERGFATRVAAWGTVPDAPRTYRYVDLSSTEVPGCVATFDYGAGTPAQAPEVFVGHRMRLAALGLKPRADQPCFLAASHEGPKPRAVDLWLSPGDEGMLALATGRKARFRVLGVVHRSLKIEGERYTWEEYVLHAPDDGLRWLAVADGQWSLSSSVDAGRVAESPRGVRLDGVAFRALSTGKTRVEWASGQFPWSVRKGDASVTRDFVRAREVLSCERSGAEDDSESSEITWSLSTRLRPEEVARAFGKPAFSKSRGADSSPPANASATKQSATKQSATKPTNPKRR